MATESVDLVLFDAFLSASSEIREQFASRIGRAKEFEATVQAECGGRGPSTAALSSAATVEQEWAANEAHARSIFVVISVNDQTGVIEFLTKTVVDAGVAIPALGSAVGPGDVVTLLRIEEGSFDLYNGGDPTRMVFGIPEAEFWELFVENGSDLDATLEAVGFDDRLLLLRWEPDSVWMTTDDLDSMHDLREDLGLNESERIYIGRNGEKFVLVNPGPNEMYVAVADWAVERFLGNDPSTSVYGTSFDDDVRYRPTGDGEYWIFSRDDGFPIMVPAAAVPDHVIADFYGDDETSAIRQAAFESSPLGRMVAVTDALTDYVTSPRGAAELLTSIPGIDTFGDIGWCLWDGSGYAFRDSSGLDAGTSCAAVLIPGASRAVLRAGSEATQAVVRGSDDVIQFGDEVVQLGDEVIDGSTVIVRGPNDPPVRQNPQRGQSPRIQPNTTYQANGYSFTTDEFGRPTSASGILSLETGTRTAEQTRIGKLGDAGDEGGHLIGAQFDGPPDAFNLTPQAGSVNRGAGSEWTAMEREWADALEAGSEVTVQIDVVYEQGLDGLRPTGYNIVYEIDGIPQEATILNSGTGS